MSILNSIYGEAKGAGSSLDQMNTSLEKLLDADKKYYKAESKERNYNLTQQKRARQDRFRLEQQVSETVQKSEKAFKGGPNKKLEEGFAKGIAGMLAAVLAAYGVKKLVDSQGGGGGGPTGGGPTGGGGATGSETGAGAPQAAQPQQEGDVTKDQVGAVRGATNLASGLFGYAPGVRHVLEGTEAAADFQAGNYTGAALSGLALIPKIGAAFKMIDDLHDAFLISEEDKAEQNQRVADKLNQITKERDQVQMKQSGGFTGAVPNMGQPTTGDHFYTSVQPGSYILNRNAVAGLGFQKGGNVPVALEQGEIAFAPGTYDQGAMDFLNYSAFPRFQQGGIPKRDDNGAPSENSVVPLGMSQEQFKKMRGYKRGGKIFLHWAGSGYSGAHPNYHATVQGSGKVVKTNDYNTFGGGHTHLRNNTGIGLSLAAMNGASDSHFGSFPVKPIQYKGMANLTAKIAKEWGWSAGDISVKNVMTHAEAASGKDGLLPGNDNYGPQSWGGDGTRWDLWKLYQGDSNGTGGEKIRNMIRSAMGGNPQVEEADQSAPGTQPAQRGPAYTPPGDREPMGHNDYSGQYSGGDAETSIGGDAFSQFGQFSSFFKQVFDGVASNLGMGTGSGILGLLQGDPGAFFNVDTSSFNVNPLVDEQTQAPVATPGGAQPGTTQETQERAAAQQQVQGAAQTAVKKGGHVIEYLTGDPNHRRYRSDHAGNNYHEHIAFKTTAGRDRAMKLLRSKGIKIGSVNSGRHAATSYHYTDQAFDIPADQVPVGSEPELSRRVRRILKESGFTGSQLQKGGNVSHVGRMNRNIEKFMELQQRENLHSGESGMAPVVISQAADVPEVRMQVTGGAGNNLPQYLGVRCQSYFAANYRFDERSYNVAEYS